MRGNGPGNSNPDLAQVMAGIQLTLQELADLKRQSAEQLERFEAQAEKDRRQAAKDRAEAAERLDRFSREAAKDRREIRRVVTGILAVGRDVRRSLAGIGQTLAEHTVMLRAHGGLLREILVAVRGRGNGRNGGNGARGGR